MERGLKEGRKVYPKECIYRGGRDTIEGMVNGEMRANDKQPRWYEGKIFK